MTGLHWRASCAVSMALGGPAGKPLCARIHEASPGVLRAVATFCLDIVFGEYQHCAKIHARWLER